MSAMPEPIDLDAYEQGVRSGDRTALGRAITLVESRRPDHQDLAQELLARLLPASGASLRVGITGVPGVGKSTFIDALGTHLTLTGHCVAVLAVDPSSSRTGGSILGDRTRMARLGTDERAFIRPSPTAGTLGGVAAATREAIIVVEAAGYDTVLVETVGVGQSETTVANMTDCFLVLMLARTGDALQGIKKGVLELADILAVNKADGPHEQDAKAAARELARALALLHPAGSAWIPPVLTCSALHDTGIAEVWSTVEQFTALMRRQGEFDLRRAQQRIDWMWSTVDERLISSFRADPRVREQATVLEAELRAGTITPAAAAQRLLAEGGA